MCIKTTTRHRRISCRCRQRPSTSCCRSPRGSARLRDHPGRRRSHRRRRQAQRRDALSIDPAHARAGAARGDRRAAGAGRRRRAAALLPDHAVWRSRGARGGSATAGLVNCESAWLAKGAAEGPSNWHLNWNDGLMLFYRAAPASLPASFRAAYRAELSAVFARRRGKLGIRRGRGVWLEAIADIIRNAAAAALGSARAGSATTPCDRSSRAAASPLPRSSSSALGIGATTAAFSIADHVLLRPLPFPESDRLVQLWQDQTFRGYPRIELSPSNFLDWRRLATSFEGMAAYHVAVGQPGRPGRAGAARRHDRQRRTSFAVLARAGGARPDAHQHDDDRDATPHGRAQPAALARPSSAAIRSSSGEPIILDDAPHVIVGVMPAGFEFPTATWTTGCRCGSHRRCSPIAPTRISTWSRG